MKAFNTKFTEIEHYKTLSRPCNFNNFLQVLNCQKPSRGTMFEFIIDNNICSMITGQKIDKNTSFLEEQKIRMKAFALLGYDHITMHGCDMRFTSEREAQGEFKSVSINSGGVIYDENSFESYKWPEPSTCDYTRLEILKEHLPEGMKIVVFSPDGILENVIRLLGYENLCYLSIDDPELVEKVFEKVGTIFIEYYRNCAKYDSVGALILNDDWGFNTQTMLSHSDMRKYVLPWHKKVVQEIEKTGKPVILHSCGNLKPIMEDIIDDIKYNAKHSNEDNIYPVEAFYEDYKGRIGILGGIDLHYLCSKTPEEIYNRACNMLELSRACGGYALGSGNSIPDYIPVENYLAMIAAVRFNET